MLAGLFGSLLVLKRAVKLLTKEFFSDFRIILLEELFFKYFLLIYGCRFGESMLKYNKKVTNILLSWNAQ